MNTSREHSTARDRGEAKRRFPTVLQILPALGPQGGVERGTVEIACAVAAAGGRALVASSGGPLEREVARGGGTCVTLPLDRKNPWIMRANIGRLAALIRENDVDIVHARSRAPAWSAWLAARETGRHFVTTFHGTYSIPNWFKRRYNAVMTKGERVIAISNFIAGHVRQHYGVPASRIRVIHRGVDLERFDPAAIHPQRVVNLAGKWQLPDGVPIVLLPGRLSRWKGQAVLIEAAARLRREDVRFVLLGDAQGRVEYRRELEALIEKLDLNRVIRLIDHCDDMPAAYMLSDIVVSASTDPEAFGRVVAEAQALGRPVVASDHGGAREIVIAGETGWLTPPGDADALAAALAQALSLGGEAREQLAARAVLRIRTNFSRQAMCDRTLALYDEVMRLGAG